jgi:hypothetical protein
MSEVITLKRRQRCEKCKHWQKGEWARKPVWAGYGPAELGDCSCSKIVYADPVTASNREDAESGLFYFDSEGYGAGFLTGPEFCCIHFQERTAQCES